MRRQNFLKGAGNSLTLYIYFLKKHLFHESFKYVFLRTVFIFPSLPVTLSLFLLIFSRI